jgi:hypothetical protein
MIFIQIVKLALKSKNKRAINKTQLKFDFLSDFETHLKCTNRSKRKMMKWNS